MLERLHVWVYGQLYPAFLGSFIVALVLGAGGEPWNWGWGVLLAVYFTCQHGEGAIAKAYVSPVECLGDLAEIVLMCVAFYLLGLVPDRVPKLDPGELSRWLSLVLLLVFFVPPLFRMLHKAGRAKMSGENAGFYGSLGMLSFVAGVASVGWYGCLGLGLVVAMLAIYVLVFVLFNDRLPDRCKSFRRPKRPDPCPRCQAVPEGAA